MSKVTPPTPDEIKEAWEGGQDAYTALVQVHDFAEEGWRHGVYKTTIFRRLHDNTYWSVDYRVSTDGETHGIRDGDIEVSQVWPRRVTTTTYKQEEPT